MKETTNLIMKTTSLVVLVVHCCTTSFAVAPLSNNQQNTTSIDMSDFEKFRENLKQKLKIQTNIERHPLLWGSNDSSVANLITEDESIRLSIYYSNILENNKWMTSPLVFKFGLQKPFESACPHVVNVCKKFMPEITSALIAAPSNKIVRQWFIWISLISNNKDTYKVIGDIYTDTDVGDTFFFSSYLSHTAYNEKKWLEIIEIWKPYTDKLLTLEAQSTNNINQSVFNIEYELFLKHIVEAYVSTDNAKNLLELMHRLKFKFGKSSPYYLKCSNLIIELAKYDIGKELEKYKPLERKNNNLTLVYHCLPTNIIAAFKSEGYKFNKTINTSHPTGESQASKNILSRLAFKPTEPRWAILDSCDEPIISGGDRIYTAEIKKALNRHGVQNRPDKIRLESGSNPSNVELEYIRLGVELNEYRNTATNKKARSINKAEQAAISSLNKLMSSDYWHLGVAYEPTDELDLNYIPHRLNFWHKSEDIKQASGVHLRKVLEFIKHNTAKQCVLSFFIKLCCAAEVINLSDMIDYVGIEKITSSESSLDSTDVRYVIEALSKEDAWGKVESICTRYINNKIGHINAGFLAYKIEALARLDKKQDAIMLFEETKQNQDLHKKVVQIISNSIELSLSKKMVN